MAAGSLPVRVSSLMTFTSDPRAARVDAPAGGLALAAADVAYDEPSLSLRLLVTTRFRMSFVRSFQTFKAAVVVAIENAETGACAAIALSDPHKTYPRLHGPRFRGAPAGGTLELDGFQTGWITVPLVVTVARPTLAPAVFLTAVLHEHQSNTLAIDPVRRTVESFLGGVPAPVRHEDPAEADDEDADAP